MKLPLEYRWLKANGFSGFEPWNLLDESDGDGLRNEYQKETGNDFYPIARRYDCDDVAGFEVVEGNVKSNVINVHLTWSGSRESDGYPRMTKFNTMFDWLKEQVIDDTIDWMSEEELDDLLNDA